MTAYWLDDMPEIPLSDGVPIRTSKWSTAIVIGTHVDWDWVAYDSPSEGGQIFEEPVERWRVDLDNPQGFAYALAWFRQTCMRMSEPPIHALAFIEVANRHWSGSTTTRDRTWLARGCAAILPGT